MRRQGIQNRNRESKHVLLLCAGTFKQKSLVVKKSLAVYVLNEDPKELRVVVHLNVKLEVRGERQLNPQHRPGNGLDMCRQLKARKLVHEAMEGLSHLGNSDELPKILRFQVEITKPLDVLSLQFPTDDFGHSAELPQGRLASPHFTRHHDGEGERELREVGPAPPQRNFEEGPHDPGGALLDEGHVCSQRKSLERQPRYIRL
mmetsp:Transcript_45575/g.89041  ORF Transcript_45575/g.89041 Transcript_45575/m.89041 type:complete len:203 (-) Transcript_45575:2571-3179(-)